MREMRRYALASVFVVALPLLALAGGLHFKPIDRPGHSSTGPTGINNDGWIVGGNDASTSEGGLNAPLGFLLREGTYTDVSFPPGPSASNDALAEGINDEGEIVGTYEDRTLNSDNNERCFVRDEDGEYHSFTVPFSGPAEGVECFGINNHGDIVGTYPDLVAKKNRGWLRTEDGEFHHIDFTRKGVKYDTQAYGINDDGDIVGVWNATGATDNDGSPRSGDHCFLRHEGKYKSIDVPFSGASQTVCAGINNEGDIVGIYLGGDSKYHGFVLREGKFRTIDVNFPGVLSTAVSGINDEGWIVGIYIDNTDNTVFHGFKARLKD